MLRENAWITCIGVSPACTISSICRCSKNPCTKKRFGSPPESVPKPKRTPASTIFLRFFLSVSNARIARSRPGIFAWVSRTLPVSTAIRSGGTDLVKNGLSVKPAPSLP